MKLMRKNLKLMQSITGAVIKPTTEAIIQEVEEDTQLLEVVTEDLPITIRELHQLPKTKEHTEETVVTKAKITEEAKLKTMVETMTKTIVNIAKRQATL